VGVALLGQHAEHPRAVGADQRTRCDGGAGELDELYGPRRIGHAQPHTTEAKFPINLCPNIFHRDHHRHPIRRGAPPAGGAAPDERLIDLDHPSEQLTVGANHRPAQLVQPYPGSLIGPQPQHVVQVLRRGPVFLRGNQPDRGKPRAQRRTRAVKDRPGSHRGLAPALGTLPVLRRGLPRLVATTHRAPKAFWPAQMR